MLPEGPGLWNLIEAHVLRSIAERIDAGEEVAEVAADYGLTEAEVEQAILYERAA